MQEEYKLLHCPFCGGKAGFLEFSFREKGRKITRYEVECKSDEDDCPVSSCTLLYDTKAEAVKIWNRRAKA